MTNQTGPRIEITWAYLFCYIVGVGALAGAIAACDKPDFSAVGLCLLAAAVAFGAVAIAANRK